MQTEPEFCKAISNQSKRCLQCTTICTETKCQL